MSPTNTQVTFVGDDDTEYFRHLFGRKLNILNTNYLLPADNDEVKRCELHHRMLQYVFGGKNYIGPVKQVLQFGEHRRVLDMGTGSGCWAIEMADEFSRAEVIGIDLAPIQPRCVPPNCTFELCDLDQETIPYPANYFDLIHARFIHTGIRSYTRLLSEIYRLLRPGGLVILIEPEVLPTSHSDPNTLEEGETGSMGTSRWHELWEMYYNGLKKHGVDVTVPQRLARLLSSMQGFEDIVSRQGRLPIGFWPTDPTQLTIGQLQWMDHDLLIPALFPFFRSAGLLESAARDLIANAQHDLYYPPFNLTSVLHVVHATKQFFDK